MLAVGTQPYQAALNVFKDTTTPIVFNTVTEPYAAAKDVVKSPTDKPANVTGVQALPPVKDAMQLAQKAVPNAKRFGMIWTPAEANSEFATRLARDVARDLSIDLQEATVTSADEVLPAAQSLVAKNVDVFFISTDSTVVSALESVVKVANESRTPLFANDPASASRGAVAALGVDYADQGYDSGQIAARILKGETSAKDVAIEQSTKGFLAINTKAAELQGVVLACRPHRASRPEARRHRATQTETLNYAEPGMAPAKCACQRSATARGRAGFGTIFVLAAGRMLRRPRSR